MKEFWWAHSAFLLVCHMETVKTVQVVDVETIKWFPGRMICLFKINIKTPQSVGKFALVITFINNITFFNYFTNFGFQSRYRWQGKETCNFPVPISKICRIWYKYRNWLYWEKLLLLLSDMTKVYNLILPDTYISNSTKCVSLICRWIFGQICH